MLSDEEREALDKLSSKKNETTWDDTIRQIKREEIKDVVVTRQKYITTILNLIEKQFKEIEELKEDNQRYKRIASQKLDDIEEFRKNECEHRCIRNAEVLELKEYYQENYTPNDKIKAKIEEKFLEAKGLYERGVQPQAQYTMKLLRDLEKSLLEKEKK